MYIYIMSSVDWQNVEARLREIKRAELERLDIMAFLDSMEDTYEYARANHVPTPPEDMVMVKMRKLLDDSYKARMKREHET